ncbi:hypothetical protein CDAR_127971 [Caerostris darwini]|uniref:Uncharacterized protein n=1 Tax=Caerostris darwini TaxID=1538125 RepID=A0AAV4P2P4_9ARAC|nr:hypothetical protein CDAR_127971 [Caerostris darwini]
MSDGRRNETNLQTEILCKSAQMMINFGDESISLFANERTGLSGHQPRNESYGGDLLRKNHSRPAEASGTSDQGCDSNPDLYNLTEQN